MSKGQPVLRVLRVSLDRLDPLVLPVLQAQLVLRDQLAPLALPDPLGLLELLD